MNEVISRGTTQIVYCIQDTVTKTNQIKKNVLQYF